MPRTLHTVLTFDEWATIMAKCRNGEKRLGGVSTVLYKKDEHTFAVRYHRTDVVLIHDDGSYSLYTGNYRTATTKSRINEYSPASVSQMNFEWYIKGQVFHDGCRVDSTGNLIEDLQEYHFKTNYKEPLCV